MSQPRPTDQMRRVTIEPFATAAAGSVLISQGNTRVLCTASIAADAPRWIEKDEQGVPKHGWVTAEYAMTPGSTGDRMRRGPNSRATEIQRLIGRSLRAAVDLDKMPGLSITCDCDVLQADGGTRTASITGAYVALAQAIAAAKNDGRLSTDPLVQQIAAISVGIIDGNAVLDLDYPLDSRAEVDLNVVMTDASRLVEVQGTGEKATYDRTQLNAMLDLATIGTTQLFEVQRQALSALHPAWLHAACYAVPPLIN